MGAVAKPAREAVVRLIEQSKEGAWAWSLAIHRRSILEGRIIALITKASPKVADLHR
jgi:hypothetical protein